MIKVVREITGLGLKGSQGSGRWRPKNVKEAMPKADAEGSQEEAGRSWRG